MNLNTAPGTKRHKAVLNDYKQIEDGSLGTDATEHSHIIKSIIPDALIQFKQGPWQMIQTVRLISLRNQ